MSLKISEEFLNDAKLGWKITNRIPVANSAWIDQLFTQLAFEQRLEDWGYDSVERTAIYKWRKTLR